MFAIFEDRIVLRFPGCDFVIEGKRSPIRCKRIEFVVSAKIFNPLHKRSLSFRIDPNARMVLSSVGARESLLEHLL